MLLLMASVANTDIANTVRMIVVMRLFKASPSAVLN